MGELISKLERASKGASQPMGFGASSRREKIAPVLLIGAIEPGDAAQAKLATDAGVDAIIVAAQNGASDANIAKSVKSVKDTISGVWREMAIEGETEGADFQVFSSDATPIGSLGGEKRTNIMEVVPEWDDSRMRTLELLPVDGFLVSLTDSNKLTVNQLMRLARVRGATSRWMFAHLAEVPTKAELEELREVGVSAIVVDLAGRSADELKACKEAMLELPRESRRKDKQRSVATLPSGGFQAPSRQPAPDPDEDDEWDDD